MWERLPAAIALTFSRLEAAPTTEKQVLCHPTSVLCPLLICASSGLDNNRHIRHIRIPSALGRLYG